MVGIRVVSGDVNGGHLAISGFSDSVDESLVGSGKAVIGRDDEQRSARKFGSTFHEVPFSSVGENFAGKQLWSDTGEWRHAFGGEARSQALGKEIPLIGGY